MSRFQYSYAKAFAPASVSNVGPGFDVIGFPIDEPGDYVEAFARPAKGITLRIISGQSNAVTSRVDKNTAGKAVLCMEEQLQFEQGVELVLHKRMPIGSGLGSSAASAAAAVTAVNALLEKPLTKHELLPFALEGEALTSNGMLHGDNIVPSLIGGFCIIRDIESYSYITIPVNPELVCLVLHPQVVIETAYARSILPKEVPMKSAVKQSANAAILVASLFTNNYALLPEILHDELAEPYRKNLIPGYEAVKQLCMNRGALGFSISGSGPSLFAFFNNKQQAESLRHELTGIYKQLNIGCTIYISGINISGAEIKEVR